MRVWYWTEEDGGGWGGWQGWRRGKWGRRIDKSEGQMRKVGREEGGEERKNRKT